MGLWVRGTCSVYAPYRTEPEGWYCAVNVHVNSTYHWSTCQPWWCRHPINKVGIHMHANVTVMMIPPFQHEWNKIICSAIPVSHKLPAMPVTFVKYLLSIRKVDPLFSREKKWERRMETALHWAELLTPSARGRERRMSRSVWQLGRSSNSLRECFDSALVRCALHFKSSLPA